MSVDFKILPGVSAYHDTATEYVGLTTQAARADNYAAEERAVIRIHPDRWPKSVNKIRKKIRYVYKEAGARNFLAVVLE